MRGDDKTGQRYGMLTVLGLSSRKIGRNRMWRCRCDCGATSEVVNYALKHTKSCGCFRAINLRRMRTTHGRSTDPVFQVWCSMLARCRTASDSNWPRYGARGIRVCKRWEKFENFLEDMGERPSPDSSLDRYPDPNGDYAPGNVRWASRRDQARNRRSNLVFSLEGVTMCLADWSDRLGLSRDRTRTYLRRLGATGVRRSALLFAEE